MSSLVNPKLEGTPMIDMVPQSGKCPFNCRACYFNYGFYREAPFVPTVEEAAGKIVRICTGNDANNQRDLVVEAAKPFKDKYFCTSRPMFDFGWPVEYTCNPDETKSPTRVATATQLMAVRFRYAPWLKNHLEIARDHYCKASGVPLLITPMRYIDKADIPESHRHLYTYKKHIINPYWVLKNEADLHTINWGHRLVFVCAGYCRDCLLCVHFYRQTRAMMW